MDKGFQVLTLPTVYGEADQHRREILMTRLAELEAKFREAAKPYQDELVRIEARYAPRYVLMHGEAPEGAAAKGV